MSVFDERDVDKSGEETGSGGNSGSSLGGSSSSSLGGSSGATSGGSGGNLGIGGTEGTGGNYSGSSYSGGGNSGSGSSGGGHSGSGYSGSSHAQGGGRGGYSDHKRPGFMSYMMCALVGAIIGGMVVTLLAPSLYGGRIGSGLLSEGPKIPAPAPGTPAPSAAQPGDPPAVFVSQKLGPAVVGISNRAIGVDLFGRSAARESSGSGFIFASNGYIITNNHVVEGSTQITVSLADGRQFPATVVGADANFDLAVIKINAEGLPTAELGNSDELRVGDISIAIGNPVGSEFQRSVTQGIISGLNRVLRVGDQTFNLIQTDAVINPGNSGGPLSNTRGQVIGINTLKINLPQVEGMGFSIPINVARPVINELMTKGRIQWPWLGVYLIDKTNAAQFNLKLDRGIYLADIVANGPAARAGLKKGDIVLAIQNKEVNTVDELRQVLNQHRAGDRVELNILRGTNTQKVTVTLGEMPQQR